MTLNIIMANVALNLVSEYQKSSVLLMSFSFCYAELCNEWCLLFECHFTFVSSIGIYVSKQDMLMKGL
jgi:hypothetical protein